MSKRNKAKKPQWKPEPTDINILILGSAGVGKSTFINTAIGREIAVVGHGLESCTKDLQPIPFSKPDDPTCRIVLVDTPGFLDTYEEDIFQTERWLRMLLENDARIAGVIYLHDISQGRSMATDCVWETTQDICGQDAFQNMVIVTTKWELSPGLAECRCEEELSDIVWKRAREKGASVVRFDGTQVSARQIISLATQEPLIKPLQLERDLRRRRGGNLGHSFDKPLRSPPSDSGSTLNLPPARSSKPPPPVVANGRPSFDNMASGGEPPRSPSLSSTRNLLPAGSSKPPSPVLANHETRRPRFDSMASEGEPPKSPLDSILNLPATSEPCDPASEYVRGQAATADAEPHEEETRPSEPETPVTPASQNIWDFEEDCESERGSSDRRPSCDPPASSGSLVLPPSHSTLSVHVLPSINNSTVHLTNDVKDNITEQPTIASSPPDPDPATKTPETLDPGPTQTNISISSRFWFRILRLMGRHNTTQQQSNTKRSSNIEMHTVAPGRPKVLIYGERVAETEEETPLPHSVILFTPQPRAPSTDSQASGILDTSRSEAKLGFWYYICYCKCS